MHAAQLKGTYRRSALRDRKIGLEIPPVVHGTDRGNFSFSSRNDDDFFFLREKIAHSLVEERTERGKMEREKWEVKKEDKK